MKYCFARAIYSLVREYQDSLKHRRAHQKSRTLGLDVSMSLQSTLSQFYRDVTYKNASSEQTVLAGTFMEIYSCSCWSWHSRRHSNSVGQPEVSLEPATKYHHGGTYDANNSAIGRTKSHENSIWPISTFSPSIEKATV